MYLFHLFACVSVYVHIPVLVPGGVYMCATAHGSQRISRNRFSPSVMWVPGIELRPSGLVASDLSSPGLYISFRFPHSFIFWVVLVSVPIYHSFLLLFSGVHFLFPEVFSYNLDFIFLPLLKPFG